LTALVITTMICSVNLVSAEPDEEWSKTYGGANSDKGRSVAQTSDGGYIITGKTESYGVGLSDVWLIKTDESGNKEWSKTFGGADTDFGYSVAQTSDGNYIITGHTESFGDGDDDVWLIKVKPPSPPAPPAREHKPNPGTVFIDRNVSFSDCVRFYFILRDMNKTAANYCFTLTITDTDNQLVYARNCTVRRRINWYLFYLCKDRFPSGTYTVHATSCNWSQENQFKTH